MFTGLIQAIGHIQTLVRVGGDGRLTVVQDHPFSSQIGLGDSVAVNGVCLTAIQLQERGFTADVSLETLDKTTLGHLQPGDDVNLELALLPTTRLGGHLVSGHVDGVGDIISIREDARSSRITIRPPADLLKYIAPKGSITVNGISLTVNQVTGGTFEVNIVPHTFSNTNLNAARPGQKVNLEVDLLARYVERLLLKDDQNNLDRDFLRNNGFSD